MKKKLYLIFTILLSSAVLSLSSCLKDSRYVDFSKVGTLIELPLEAYNGVGKLVTISLPLQSTAVNFPMVVNVAAPKPLGSALTVTLGIDQSALTAYNHANGLDTGGNVPYVLLPSSALNGATTFKVTIPANQHAATLNIPVITGSLDPTALYILPLTIVDASGQRISNYKTLLFNIHVKNMYDGLYTVTGTMTDGASASITGNYPVDYYLETQGASSVALFDFNANVANTFAHEILSGGSPSYYGSFSPQFTFSGTTITGVTNYYGQFSGSRLRSASLDPTGVNAYTSGTPGATGSVFQVSYYMDQGNPAAHRTHFVETFTYKGPRP